MRTRTDVANDPATSSAARRRAPHERVAAAAAAFGAMSRPVSHPVAAHLGAGTPAHDGAALRQALAVELARRADVGDPSSRAPARAWMRAAAAACRATLEPRWARTQAQDREAMTRASPHAALPPRRVHYLSMEFLMGRALGNALAALGLEGDLREQLAAGGLSLPDVLESERDMAVGNGGLGRLAACFLDSFATLGLPAFGYGVRYQYGMFAQRIVHGQQVEAPDDWLRDGNPWEIPRRELCYEIGFGGRVEHDGAARRWVPEISVQANAYDFIVPGHGTERVATLRQWHASALHPIDFVLFCRGEHLQAGREHIEADVLNWVLYPDDSTHAGRQLRLKQEYFLVSASLQDMLARHLREQGRLDDFGARNVVHLNDTHPALAPVELMRLLIDVHGFEWDAAWAQVRAATSYTNHTLMPEALEHWPVQMLKELLPRHLEIVFEINHRFLDAVRALHPHDDALAARMSLIDESGERRVRMASLSIAASRRVNGVSELHSQLMVRTIFADFARLWPERFTNVTNGVTPRRWLLQANPALSTAIDAAIGDAWRHDLDRLADLAPLAADRRLGDAVMRAKRHNKERLAALIGRELGVEVDPAGLFDVQVKRIHEYKRQLLNLLHVIARLQAIVAEPHVDWQPRTVVLAGKAATAYVAAKTIVRLAHDVARVVNDDPRVAGRLKLVFLPNYSVSLAEAIIPAADLSQQISTAGTEASGTGNMKLALNGALTIGTWDGANIEMAQAMGEAQMFVFGLRAEQVAREKELGYDPRRHYEDQPVLRAVIDALLRGDFSPDEPQRYRALVESLLYNDTYMLLADFASYLQAQQRVDALYREPGRWAEAAVRNVAAMGRFSSDRTIRDYVDRIWSRGG